MTVQCPRCSTQYRVPEARLSDPRPVFKCTRCNHVFSRGEKPAARGGRGRGDSRNLAFPFASGGARGEPASGHEAEARADEETAPAVEDEDVEEELVVEVEDEAEAAADDEVEEEDTEEADDEPLRAAPVVRRPEPSPPRRAAAPARAPEARAERPAPRSASPRGSDPAFVADLPRGRDTAPARGERTIRSEPPRRRPEPSPELDDELEVEDDVAEAEDDGPLLIKERGRAQRGPVQPRRRGAPQPGRSPLRPVAIGVGAVVAAFLVLAAILARRPELAFERLGAVPLLGRLLGDDHLLVWRLQIGGVDSTIDHIKGDKPALVVSGHVLNTTSQNLRLIEVEGRLLSDGVERRRQVVYAANQFRKTIRDLSASEVEMLLRLEPNRRFVVRPGESASFLIVFPNPPDNATEVTCRVVDARPA